MKYRLVLINKELFWWKLKSLCVVTLLFIPFLAIKNTVPAFIYISALLIIHIYILYLYLMKTNWRELSKSPSGFISRCIGILFFTYLLILVKFQGDIATILVGLGSAVILHIALLLLLMGKIQKITTT